MNWARINFQGWDRVKEFRIGKIIPSQAKICIPCLQVYKSGSKKGPTFKECTLVKNPHFSSNPHETW